MNFLALGSNTPLTTPFGVDATVTDVQGYECFRDPYGDPIDGQPLPINDGSCDNWSYTDHDPIVTLNTPGQVYWQGAMINVGSRPTAIKTYWTQSQTDSYFDPTYSYHQTITQPTRAIVVNSDSNSVSIVDLVGAQAIASLAVGVQPTEVLVTSDETRAYITNYGSNTVTEVNLQNNTVTRTMALGTHPSTLALDPSGTAFWVGGQGWASKVDMVSLSTLTTLTVNGTITSMAASNAQNTIVYTVATNSAAPYSTYAANISYPGSYYSVRKIALSTMNTEATTTAAGFGDAYQYAASSTYTPSPSLLARGTIVSASFGNGLSVSATPDGFVVMDVGAGYPIMTGRTPTPVRGIATDRGDGVAYLAVPDSNMLITVPINPQ